MEKFLDGKVCPTDWSRDNESQNLTATLDKAAFFAVSTVHCPLSDALLLVLERTARLLGFVLRKESLCAFYKGKVGHVLSSCSKLVGRTVVIFSVNICS